MHREEMGTIVDQVAADLGLTTDTDGGRFVSVLRGEDKILDVKYMGQGDAELEWGPAGQAMQLRVREATLAQEMKALIPDLIKELDAQ